MTVVFGRLEYLGGRLAPFLVSGVANETCLHLRRWRKFQAQPETPFPRGPVDTQLTTDMIELASIYDAAIILSGDADYLPPVSAIKRKGKLVYSVSFLDQKGVQLPGGARRLSNAVDSRLDLSFEATRRGLSVEPVAPHSIAIKSLDRHAA
jgi:hypothetical protein